MVGICGLLSGVGCLVLRLCGSLSVSRDGGFLEDALHVAPTLLLGGVVFGIFKLRLHPALLAPPLAVASACFYGAVGVSPEALAGARGRGWLFDAPSAAGDGGAWFPWGASGVPDPGALSACAPTALALVALALLKNSLMLLAMDRALELPDRAAFDARGSPAPGRERAASTVPFARHDELALIGAAHCAAAVLGGFGASPMTAPNVLLRDVGRRRPRRIARASRPDPLRSAAAPGGRARPRPARSSPSRSRPAASTPSRSVWKSTTGLGRPDRTLKF